jgi:hypothetical protein
MNAHIVAVVLMTGGSAAALVLTGSQGPVPDMIWGAAAGFCLTLAGTLAAAILGLPQRAWGRRIVVGAAAGMLAWGLATALMAWWGARLLAGPTWLCLAAPFLGALGGLLESFVEGALAVAGVNAEGRKMRRGG